MIRRARWAAPVAVLWLGLACGAQAAPPVCRVLPREAAGTASALVAAADGALWYADAGSQRLLRAAAPDGAKVPPAADGPPAVQATSLAFAPDGALWFTTASGARIGRRLPGGDITETAVAGGGRVLRDLVAGPDGAMWFHDPMRGELGRISPSGEVQTFPGPSWRGRHFSADGLASGAGWLWLTASVHNAVYRVSTAGEFTRLDLPTPNAMPQAIAAAPDGSIWFTMFGAQRLGRVSLAGRIEEIDVAPHNPGPLVVARDGTAWFTMRTASMVGRVRPDGTLEKFPCGNHPSALALGPDGRLWAMGERQWILVDEGRAH